MIGFAEGIDERLGFLPQAVARLHAPIWLHAASVGEVLAAEPLIRVLRVRYPKRELLLTTTSLTGRRTARERLPVDAVMLLPLDLPPIVGSVMRRLRPQALILIETEIWPSLLRAAERQGVPTALVSGRISERTARRYRLAHRWFARTLGRLSVLAMQSAEDAGRLVAAGAPHERVRVLGNLKFARSACDSAGTATSALRVDRHRTVLIAASTHAGEEPLVLESCTELLRADPTLLLILAPRRPERFDEVAGLLQTSGLRWSRHSRSPESVPDDTQVLLLDSIGELPALLPLARGVYVGGTLGSVGGHNVLEPAIYGKPVVFGPDTAKVEEQATALLAVGGARRIHDAEQLRQEWGAWIADPQLARRAGEAGRALVESRAKVAEEIADTLAPLLSASRTLS